VDINKGRHGHTHVVVVKGMYMDTDDSTWEVSTEGYQFKSWIWKLDYNFRIGWMGFPIAVLGIRESCWC